MKRASEGHQTISQDRYPIVRSQEDRYYRVPQQAGSQQFFDHSRGDNQQRLPEIPHPPVGKQVDMRRQRNRFNIDNTQQPERSNDQLEFKVQGFSHPTVNNSPHRVKNVESSFNKKASLPSTFIPQKDRQLMFMKQSLTSQSSILNSNEGKTIRKIQHNHEQRQYIGKLRENQNPLTKADRTRNFRQNSQNPNNASIDQLHEPIHINELGSQKISGALQLRELALSIRNSSPNSQKDHWQYWRDLSQMDDAQLKQVYDRLSQQSHSFLGLQHERQLNT